MTEWLMLPAPSSIATRDEMAPLAARLAGESRVLDWPGFGAAWEGRLDPAAMRAFVQAAVAGSRPGTVGIAAGHGAQYLAEAARREPGRLGALVLVAPTWRGPLPTMALGMFGGDRPGLYRRVRRALELPVVGPALFRMNLSRAVVGMMMREHVYAEAGHVTRATVAAKCRVARRAGARFGTAAFVSGGLDPAGSREEFLAAFGAGLPPVLMIRPEGAPERSGAEMDALAASGLVTTVRTPGALAAHEEYPDEVAAAVRRFVR